MRNHENELRIQTDIGALIMTDKELHRLSREELLQMLLQQTREVERLEKELAAAQQALNDRSIMLAQAGNIAEASLKINRVFEAAQRAAEQYIINVHRLYTQGDKAQPNGEEAPQ